jgi:hypothetical protein
MYSAIMRPLIAARVSMEHCLARCVSEDMEEFFAAMLEVVVEFLVEGLFGLGGEGLGALIPHSGRLGSRGSILGLMPPSRPQDHSPLGDTRTDQTEIR